MYAHTIKCMLPYKYVRSEATCCCGIEVECCCKSRDEQVQSFGYKKTNICVRVRALLAGVCVQSTPNDDTSSVSFVSAVIQPATMQSKIKDYYSTI